MSKFKYMLGSDKNRKREIKKIIELAYRCFRRRLQDSTRFATQLGIGEHIPYLYILLIFELVEHALLLRPWVLSCKRETATGRSGIVTLISKKH